MSEVEMGKAVDRVAAEPARADRTDRAVTELRRVRPALRVGPVSLVLRPVVFGIVLALVVTVFALFCLDIAVGDTHIPLGRVLDVLGGGGTRSQRFIIIESRLPRALTAVVVGAALGLSGALMQSILHNPLAGPDVLGITTGASVGAVAVLVGSGGATTGLLATVGAPIAALTGGLLTAVVIYLLAWGRGGSGEHGVTGFRLVLIGIGVNAVLLSVISWLLTRASLTDAARAQLWLTGSLNGADMSRVVPAVIALAVVTVVSLVSARTLAALRLGEDSTRVLGVRIQSQQALLIGASVVAASVATAAVGPVGFVALAAPQIARMALRTAGEPLIASALTGAALVAGADVVSRALLPVDLPVGIVTAALGGPFLLYLLVRMNRKATLS
ncbi:iron chelate uptake ABC transporter family permease subunit [Nocardia salmonicida]|uniref:Iron chelate uptake ABC transporter family permease subunit n=2 Tax=Nocardia salmonicida TaxID=53431 RepID=A0ABZ1N4I2_9NOCA|nr:iron chelate uptake ABC transporter family permease subunit [Nocardia salmonicida]